MQEMQSATCSAAQNAFIYRGSLIFEGSLQGLVTCIGSVICRGFSWYGPPPPPPPTHTQRARARAYKDHAHQAAEEGNGILFKHHQLRFQLLQVSWQLGHQPWPL